MKKNPCLLVKNLSISFYLNKKKVQVIQNISFSIKEGENFCLLGESGGGKSVIALAILGLLPENAHVEGNIFFLGKSILKNNYYLKKLRGKDIVWIPQNPSSSLNPLLKVDYQLSETLLTHLKLKGKGLIKKLEEIFNTLNIFPGEKKIKFYPHELSGGQKQRILVSIGIATNPKLIIADEPTKGLDPLRRYDILKIFKDIKVKNPKSSFLLITHDLGFAKKFASRIGIIFGGTLIEICDNDTFFKKPLHPYSKLLLEAFYKRRLKLTNFEPDLNNTFEGCRFFYMCKYRLEKCKKSPPFMRVGKNWVRCHLYA